MTVDVTPVLVGRDGRLATAPSDARALLGIARIDSRHALRSPFNISALVLVVLQYRYLVSGIAPNLAVDDARIAQSTMPLACAAIVLVSLAVLRPAVSGLSDVVAVQPLGRYRAHCAFAGVAGLLAAEAGVLELALIVWRGRLDYSVGSPSVLELLAGPAAVLLAGTVALLTTTLLRSMAPAPFLILAVAGIQAALPDGGLSPSAVFLPFVPVAPHVTPEFEVRSPGLHLVYVTGLTLLAVAATGLVAAAIGHVERPTRRFSALCLALCALAVVAATAAASGQSIAASDATRRETLEQVGTGSRLDCRVAAEGVDVCVYPRYRDWADEWSTAIEAMTQLTGRTVEHPVRIEQVPAPFRHEIYGRETALELNRLTDRRAAEVVAAPIEQMGGTPVVSIAAGLVDLPMLPRSDGLDPPDQHLLNGGRRILYPVCDAREDGRAIVALVLAATESPAAFDHLSDLARSARRYAGQTSVGVRVDVGGARASFAQLLTAHAIMEQVPAADRAAALGELSRDREAPLSNEQVANGFGVTMIQADEALDIFGPLPACSV